VFEEQTTLDNFECYAQNGVSLLFSTLWDRYLDVVPTFAINYNRAKTAGIANYDAVININDASYPIVICTHARFVFLLTRLEESGSRYIKIGTEPSTRE